MAKRTGKVEQSFIKPIVLYRRYYVNEKQHLTFWKKRQEPKWFKDTLLIN